MHLVIRQDPHPSPRLPWKRVCKRVCPLAFNFNCFARLAGGGGGRGGALKAHSNGLMLFDIAASAVVIVVLICLSPLRWLEPSPITRSLRSYASCFWMPSPFKYPTTIVGGVERISIDEYRCALVNLSRRVGDSWNSKFPVLGFKGPGKSVFHNYKFFHVNIHIGPGFDLDRSPLHYCRSYNFSQIRNSKLCKQDLTNTMVVR